MLLRFALLLASLFLSFATVPAFSQQTLPAQFTTVSGKSLAEKKVKWLWSVLPVVVKACRAQTSCQMTADELKILDSVVKNLGYYDESSLQFLPEKGNESIFSSSSNEAHRTAVTGNTPQAKIILNTDRLANLGLTETLALLVHEVTHHVGVLDDVHRIPDQMGAKMGHYFEANSVSLNLEEYNHPEIQAYYFGVGIPEAKDYFRLFPEPLNARTGVWDNENLYDIYSYDLLNTSNCYRYPNDTYVGQKVSNPYLRIYRWFPGDQQVTLNMHVKTMNVCWDRSRPEDVNLRGVQLIGQLTLQLNLADSTKKDWSQSSLKIQSDSFRTSLRLTMPQEALDALNLATIEKVISAPATVQAGQVWKFQALVRYPGTEQVLGCAAAIRQENWHSLDLFGIVPPGDVDRCQAQKISEGLYQVTLEKDIPVDSYAGTFKLEMLGLAINSPNRMVTSKFPSAISFNLENSHPPLPLKILGYKFIGANNNELRANQTYDFEVRIQNAKKINYPFISGQIIQAGNANYNFVGDMDPATGDNPFRDGKYRLEGDVLVATYKATIPSVLQGPQVQKFKIMTLHFITTNLGEAYLDLRSQPDTYLIK